MQLLQHAMTQNVAGIMHAFCEQVAQVASMHSALAILQPSRLVCCCFLAIICTHGDGMQCP